MAANRFCSSITTLFKKTDVILSEPSDIEEAPIITGTLKIHKFTGCPPTATGDTQINFLFLSNSKGPCCTEKCTTKRRYLEPQFRTSGAYCMERHMDVDESQDWLRCPICMQWFH